MKHPDPILLTINTGSSSVRLALFRCAGDGPQLLARSHHDSADEMQAAVLRDFSGAWTDHVDLVVHRVVHGGSHLGEACVINEAVEHEIERMVPVAPLHNPMALDWIRAGRTAFGADIRQVAVFDTSFFTGLPLVASTYALPQALCRELDLRRHGFHGIAHSFMLRSWQAARPDLPGGGKVITIQLGSGCSMAAVDGGRVMDTSMGFSPMEGLVMATRCGDLDPGLVIYLQRHAGRTVEEIDRLLNEESGLAGISEQGGDMRRLLESDTPGAELAIDIYCYRVRKYIGAYLAVLNGLDGIVFGGGVGENSPEIREEVIGAMDWLDTSLDASRNEDLAGGEGLISAAGGRVEVRVVHVDESTEMARVASGLTGISDNGRQ